MESLTGKINAILKTNAGTRVNGKVASERTKTARGEAIHAGFARLVAGGFRIQNPENIREEHIRAICESMYNDGLKPKTIQSNLSNFRIFCRWIGKGDMVKSVNHYLPNVPAENLRVVNVAVESKSWAAQGIDVAEKVREADAIDRRFGAMLRLALAFGLRRHEVIECKPWKVDQGDKFAAYKTKGGRPRDIYIQTAEQRVVLDYVKSMVKKNERLGWTTMDNGSEGTVEFALKKWYRMLAKIGITKKSSLVSGHGLRAQYAENAALIANVIPPTLGGTGGQMPKEDLNLKRLQISELLGHSRPSITTAYCGSFGRNNTADSPDRTKIAVEAAARSIPEEKLRSVPTSRIPHCSQLLAELAAVECFIEIRVAQALWENHSSRHATEWLSPGANNIAALETAAIHFAGAV